MCLVFFKHLSCFTSPSTHHKLCRPTKSDSTQLNGSCPNFPHNNVRKCQAKLKICQLASLHTGNVSMWIYTDKRHICSPWHGHINLQNWFPKILLSLLVLWHQWTTEMFLLQLWFKLKILLKAGNVAKRIVPELFIVYIQTSHGKCAALWSARNRPSHYKTLNHSLHITPWSL